MSNDRKAAHIGEVPTDSLDVLNIYSVETQQSHNKKQPKLWYILVQLCNTKVGFKVDTGSEWNTLTETDYNKISPKPEMMSAGNVALRLYKSNRLIRPLSKVFITYNASLKIENYVVRADEKVNNLLCFETSEDVGLYKTTCELTETPDLIQKNTDLFNDLSHLPYNYSY